MTAIRALRRGEGRTRHLRRPTFPIAGIMKPYGLYPLMCHPVAPGDTLTHLEGQFECSKGIKHPLVGAWLEMWAVYVRLTDLQRPTAPDQPPPILAQFIKEGVSTAGVTFAAASPRYFGIGAQVKWLQLITERVAKAFFFHSEEPLRTIDGVPQIKMLGANWYQNAVFTPANVAPVATDVEALDEQISQTQLGRLGDMIELTYDRWVEEGASSRKSGLRVSLKFCGISGSGRFPPTRSSRPLVFPPPAGRGAASSPWRRPSGSMNRASSFWSVLCAPRCMRPSKSRRCLVSFGVAAGGSLRSRFSILSTSSTSCPGPT